jgi:hypothetical protein
MVIVADRAAKSVHAPRDLRVGHERGLLGAQVTPAKEAWNLARSRKENPPTGARIGG